MKDLKQQKDNEWRPEIGGKLVYPERIEPDTAGLNPIYVIKQAMYEQIVEQEEKLALKKEQLLIDTGAKNMFDKKALNQSDIDEYEMSLKDIADAKLEFKEDFGVDFAEYIPFQSADLQVSENQLHKHELYYQGNKPKIDRTYVAQKKLEVYRQQYPNDKEIDLVKLEQIELDPKTQAEVDEWLYNQRLQEKYERFFYQQQGLVGGQRKDENGFSYSLAQRYKELDDVLVKRIQMHLNENHERDIQISKDFEHDTQYESQLTDQQFDSKYEDAIKEGYKQWLGDFARQQELVFEMKTKQLKIDQALNQINYNALKDNQVAKKKEIAQMKLMELSDWKKLEDEQKAELEENQQEFKKVILAVSKGDQELKAALEKSLLSNNAQQDDSSNDSAALLAAKINAHEALLTLHRSQGIDPVSKLFESITQNVNKQNLPVTHLLYEHQMKQSGKANLNEIVQIENSYATNQSHQNSTEMTQQSLEENIEKSYKLTEDAILANMAQGQIQFDMSQIIKDLPVPQITHHHGIQEPDDKINSFTKAQTADQVIQAAKTQKLSPMEERLARLYNPDNTLREVYLRSKYQMFINDRLRQQLAFKILEAQDALEMAQNSRQFLQVAIDDILKQYQGTIIPKKVHEFIENSKQKKEKNIGVTEILDRIQIFNPNSSNVEIFNDELEMQNHFLKQVKNDADKKQILRQQDYILKQMAQNGIKPNVKTHSLLFEKSVIREDFLSANQNLRSLLTSADASSAQSYITNDSLHTFFCNSISQDNFDGLAYLVNYIEQRNIDISNWEMDRFRSGLDFYLNHAFNISKVLTFTRFYVHYVSSALMQSNVNSDRNNLKEMSEEDLALLHDQVFGKVQDLVDMHALFGHLVDKVGNRQLIDPISKTDPMVNIIDLFSKPEISQISKLSLNGNTFISEEDVAKYLLNHVDKSKSFAFIEKQLIQNMNNDYLLGLLIDRLRLQLIKNRGVLPECLSQDNVKKLYLKVKTISSQNDNGSDGKISARMAELLLFLFRANQMIPEAVDLCSNFGKIVDNANHLRSDIRNYHMSDALLRVDFSQSEQGENQHYYSLIEKAVFEQDSSKESPAYLVAMTKAYLKDGNNDHALKFFNEGLQKRRDNLQKQEEMLISMFDSAFGLDKNHKQESLSITAFTSRYYNLIAARQKLKQEAIFVQSLDDILQRCDPSEIDHIFSLQALLREERLLLQKMSGVDPLHYSALFNLYESQGFDANQIEKFVLENLKEKHPDELKLMISSLKELQIEAIDEQLKEHAEFANSTYEDQVQVLPDLDDNQSNQEKQNQMLAQKISQRLLANKKRKHAIHAKLSDDNYNRVLKLMSQVQDDKVDLLDNVKNLKETMSALGFSASNSSMNIEDYNQNDSKINQVIEQLQLESSIGATQSQEEVYSEFIRRFKQTVQESTEQSLNEVQELQSMEQRTLFDKFVDKNPNMGNVADVIEQHMYNDLDDGWPERKDEAQVLEEYAKFLYEDEMEDEADEEDIVKEEIYDEAVSQYQEELKEVVYNRRSRSLSYAIATFNKIQNKELPLWLRAEGELNTQRQNSDLNMIRANRNKFDKNKQKSGVLHLFENEDDLGSVSFDDQKNEQYYQNIISKSKLKDPNHINETLERYQFLLTDHQSPFLSNFMSLLDYTDGRDFMSMEQFYQKYGQIQANSPQFEKYAHPLRVYMNQSEKLITLCEQLDMMTANALEIQAVIFQKGQEIKEEIERSHEFKDWYSNQKSEKLKKIINQNVTNLYEKFIKQKSLKAQLELKGKVQTDLSEFLDEENDYHSVDKKANRSIAAQLSRKEKLEQMQISLELTGQSQYEVLNVFYAEDLIAFGIENNIPVAVRLGEKLFTESDQKLSPHLATAIKNYKLNHAATYNDAIKMTGPIDTGKAYRSARLQSSDPFEKYSRSSLVNMDDPYWHEYFQRNNKAEDHHRLPSALAWDHKEDGILGEIFDLKKLQKDVERINKNL